MTDRELLELAAKAAGITDAKYNDMTGWGGVRYGFEEALWSDKLYDQFDTGYWNPLASNDDALRLAIDLRLDMTDMQRGISWDDPDRYAKTRRAIVRAAAAMAHAASKVEGGA